MRADRAASRMAAAITRADVDDAVKHARRWCEALNLTAAAVDENGNPIDSDNTPPPAA